MAKRISVSISDELHNKLEVARKLFPGKIQSSKICQEALNKALEEIEAYSKYRDAGIEDGKRNWEKLPNQTVHIICEGMVQYPLLKLEEERQILIKDIGNDLYMHGEKNFFFKRIENFIDDEEVLHSWVNNDKRTMQAVHYYTEGLYLGIAEIDI